MIKLPIFLLKMELGFDPLKQLRFVPQIQLKINMEDHFTSIAIIYKTIAGLHRYRCKH